MSRLPVANYLTELAPESVRRTPRESLGRREGDVAVAEARAAGVSAGRAAAEAEAATQLARQAAAAAERLTAERQRWVAEEAQTLADGLAAAASDIERRLSNQVARVLKPFLTEGAADRALSDLARTLSGLLVRSEAVRLTIAGPDDLIAALKEKLGPRGEGAVLERAPLAEVRVSLDETILETRIGAWVEAINGENP